MSSKSILVVEDDEDILELIAYNLEKSGFAVTKVDTGEAALEHLKRNSFDLVLLDLMLPEINGLEICKQLKANTSTRSIPIIMVTAKGEESDIVMGLELGADDYIAKPFRPKELVARAKAVLRRASHPQDKPKGEIIKAGDIEIHLGKREVRGAGKIIDLSYTEFEVLRVLAEKPGWVFTRHQLVDSVRGDDYPVTDRSVDVQIVGLRKKLGELGSLITTVRGVGYRFMDPLE